MKRESSERPERRINRQTYLLEMQLVACRPDERLRGPHGHVARTHIAKTHLMRMKSRHSSVPIDGDRLVLETLVYTYPGTRQLRCRRPQVERLRSDESRTRVRRSSEVLRVRELAMAIKTESDSDSTTIGTRLLSTNLSSTYLLLPVPHYSNG